MKNTSFEANEVKDLVNTFYETGAEKRGYYILNEEEVKVDLWNFLNNRKEKRFVLEILETRQSLDCMGFVMKVSVKGDEEDKLVVYMEDEIGA